MKMRLIPMLLVLVVLAGLGAPAAAHQAATGDSEALPGMEPLALGNAYFYGIGMEPEYEQAAAWYRKTSCGGCCG